MPPSKRRKLSPASVWDQPILEQAFAEAGVKAVHVQRLYRHLISHPDAAWQDVPDLPQAAIALLAVDFTRSSSTLLGCQTSASGDTTKLLVQLQDRLQVEAVVMHYDTRVANAPREPSSPGSCAASDDEAGSAAGAHSSVSREPGQGRRRATLCVSSQVGCAMDCKFCATGTMGFKADLTAGEIVEQLVHAAAVTPIRNVVFMGMGEPLNNYPAVVAAARFMTDQRFFSLRRSAVTVSTVGVIPRMLQLAQDLPGISLALSLHAPTQDVRQAIVPSARSYPLDKLVAALDQYQMQTRQRVFIEYVMLAGVNDSAQQAHQLGRLLQGRDLVINLIPWNPVFSPEFAFKAPGDANTTRFQATLREDYGLPCTVRQEKGQDIAGACGQLVVQQSGGKCSSPLTDLEDIALSQLTVSAQ